MIYVKITRGADVLVYRFVKLLGRGKSFFVSSECEKKDLCKLAVKLTAHVYKMIFTGYLVCTEGRAYAYVGY